MNIHEEESEDKRRGFSGISSMVSDAKEAQAPKEAIVPSETTNSTDIDRSNVKPDSGSASAFSSRRPRLARSKTSKVLAGVCGGLGDYFGIDPVFIRLIWLATFLFGGTGLLAYLLAWIILPVSDGVASENRFGGTKGVRIFGLVLIVLALVLIGSTSGWISDPFPWEWMAPISLLALGAAFLFRRKS